MELNLNSEFLEMGMALCKEKLEGKNVVLISSNEHPDLIHNVMSMVIETFPEKDQFILKEDLPIIIINPDVHPDYFVSFLRDTYGDIEGYITFGLNKAITDLLQKNFGKNGQS